MANVQSGYHSFFFCLSEDKQHTLLKLGIFCVIYFLGAHHTQTATLLIYIYLHVILSLRME